MAPLPLSRLWGVGKVTEEALQKAGYHTIGDIAAASPETLQPIVGNQAQRIYRLSLGRITGRWKYGGGPSLSAMSIRTAMT